MTQFKDFVDAIPHGRYNDFRKRVIVACGVSDGQFRAWKTGTPVKKEKNRKAINRIALDMFGKTVFSEEGGEERRPAQTAFTESA